MVYDASKTCVHVRVTENAQRVIDSIQPWGENKNW